MLLFLADQACDVLRAGKVEVAVDIRIRKVSSGQQCSACCAWHQFACTTYIYAPSLSPPKGRRGLVYSTLSATTLATMFSLVCLVLDYPDLLSFPATFPAEGIYLFVQEVIDILCPVLRLRCILSASGAWYFLAGPACDCTTSELGRPSPPSAACTECDILLLLAGPACAWFHVGHGCRR